MVWRPVGSVTVTPFSDEVVVGPVEVPTVGGVSVKVGGASAAPFPFGFCLLSFRSRFGRELGTIRVWPRAEMAVSHLGAGLVVMENQGVLVVEPRSWNLRWARAGFPVTFQVLADVATDLPPDRFRVDDWVDIDNRPLLFIRSGLVGLLDLTP